MHSITNHQRFPKPTTLLRASVYQFNRDFAGARVHYQAVIDRFPQSSTVPNARYQIARGLYNEAKYEEAIPILQKVFGPPLTLSVRFRARCRWLTWPRVTFA